MVEGDECIGYKCIFAVFKFQPPALEITTGMCVEKEKKKRAPGQSQKRKTRDDDPLRYPKLLDQKKRERTSNSRISARLKFMVK